MGQLPILKAAGLHTAHNPFSESPDGGLSIARNVVIFSNGVISPRRGFKQLGYTFSAPTTELSDAGFFFGETLLAHVDGDTLVYDTGSAFSDYSGTYSAVDDTLLRMKTLEASQNFYFNTNTGNYALESVSSTPRLAGLPAPMIAAYAEVAGGTTVIDDASHLAVRATYIYEDSNGNLIEGPPSQRVLAVNDSPDDAHLVVVHNPAAGLPAGTRIRFYGSEVTAIADEPGDTLYLFYEAADVTEDQYEFHTYSLSDVPLYTNARAEGIGSANYAPPIAKDICLSNGRVLYSNTTSVQRFSLAILGTGASDGVQIGDTITINDTTFTAVDEGDTPSTYEFRVYTGGTVSENIEDTARDLVRAINGLATGVDAGNSAPDTGVIASYTSPSGGTPGSFVLEADSLGEDPFNIYSSRATAWNPELPATAETAFESSDDARPNAVYYSKDSQPESVPLLNYLLIGAKNKQIIRSIPLRDKTFVFKEDGIYTIAGDEPFAVDLLDATTRLVAADTAVVLNNQIICLSNQGVVSVSDAGVQVLSRGIEDAILPYLNSSQRSTIKRYAFAVAHETDRVYELHLPGAGVSDSRCTNQTFVFHAMSGAWTVWDGFEATWGAVSPTDVRSYGSTSGRVLRERRDYASSDHADLSMDVTVSGYSGTTLTLSSTAGVTVGDALSITKSNTTQSVTVTAVPSSTTLTVSESILDALQSGSTAVVDLAFESEVRWLPVSYDRPGTLKRFQYGTLHLARGSAFISGYAVYATEMNSGIDTETVQISTGGFGSNAWGSAPWGDAVSSFNQRHIIPAEMQRAATLSPGFKIREARKSWKLLGVSLDTSETSERNQGP